MLPEKTKTDDQYNLMPDLLTCLNKQDPLILLSFKLPWTTFEQAFAPLYSTKGRRAKPVRLMVGLLLLKQMFNLSDEQLIVQWIQNPYWQAFCGMIRFQWKAPCNPSELAYFRKRIGETGVQQIFAASIQIHGKAAQEDEVIVDTTVQEKKYCLSNRYTIAVISHLSLQKNCYC